METPVKGFFRLSPGVEVRLRYAYFVKCTGVEKDAAGAITAVRCTYDPATHGGDAPDKRKVKATLHWVSANHASEAEVRLYDYETVEASPEIVEHAYLEPALAATAPGETVQFERLGYFCRDNTGRATNALSFHRTIGLRDTWAKVKAKS